MEKKELQEFIYFFTHNKSLTRAQQLKRDALLARDYVGKEDNSINITKPQSVTNSEVFKALSALETAQFFSLFNNPMGLKYLTHDFDSVNDGRPQTLESLYSQAKEILKEKKNTLPFSLWVLINSYVEGKNSWTDTFGKVHNSFINDSDWKKWSVQNKLHPICNTDYSKEILSFRSTVRLVSPLLNEICDNAKKGLSINVKEEKLERAYFYTNTYILYMVIKRIFCMMNRRADKCPEVSISYKRTTDSQGRMLRQIIISQIGSYATQPIDDIKEKLISNNEAGDFGAIRKSLNGYCLWQVESLWDGQPLRWNLLKTDGMQETDVISKDSITGFTHILTYYIV